IILQIIREFRKIFLAKKESPRGLAKFFKLAQVLKTGGFCNTSLGLDVLVFTHVSIPSILGFKC
ncbi:MAG TPA: hypothetical protein DIU26_05775, partial [Sutterellaceae bacterium]|nr:hypothetical protein [Sutterellaceae bacterium]